MTESFGDWIDRQVKDGRWGSAKALAIDLGVKDSTLSRARNSRTGRVDLAIVLRRAEEAGLISRAPRVRMAPEIRPGKIRALSKREARTLLAHTSGQIRLLVVLALSTGLRRAELLNLRWADLDLTAREVTVDNRPAEGVRTKSGRMRVVGLRPEVVRMLKARRALPGAYVFTVGQGKRKGDRWAWYESAFRAACRAAGLERVTLHTLRHTYATRMLETGANIRDLADALGHRSIETTMRYIHQAPGRAASLARRADLLPKSMPREHRPARPPVARVARQAGKPTASKVPPPRRHLS